MTVSLVVTIGFMFLFFFATNIQTLLAAKILCGIPWGSECYLLKTLMLPHPPGDWGSSSLQYSKL